MTANLMVNLVVSLCVAAPATEKGIGVQAIQESREVTATGHSANPDNAMALDEAKKDAMRNAVEKVAGVYVNTSSVAEGDDLLHDVIHTQSRGYVTDVRVLSKGRQADGLYAVTIKCKVSEKQLLDKVEKALAEKGRPKIGMLVSELIGDKQNPGRTVYARLNRFMVDKGYEMISTDFLMAEQGPRQLRQLMANPVALAKLAKAKGIEVLILCRAQTKLMAIEKVYGMKVARFNTEINMEAVRSSNLTLLFSESLRFDGVTNPDHQRRLGNMALASGNSKGIKELDILIEDATPVMNIRMLDRWARETVQGSRIAITVRGLTFRQRIQLKNGLQGIKGVKTVTQGKFSRQETVFDVYTTLTAEQLATHIVTTIKDPPLDVEAYDDGNVKLFVVGGVRGVPTTRKSN